MEYSFQPIGVFHCAAKFPYDAPRQGSLATDADGVVELFAGKGFELATSELAGFSRLWIIFVFDRNLGVWHPKVQPPRHVNPKVGVFATRSPYRPNPIGLTCAEVVAVNGRFIHVKAHDLLDGTPVLDLKPYLPYADAIPEAKAGWTDDATPLYKIEYGDVARRQINWLAAHGVDCLEQFIRTRLEAEPLNKCRNRLIFNKLYNNYRLCYRTWRIAFQVAGEPRSVQVLEISSGYSAAELVPEAPDPYQDKALHREFQERDFS